jgi:hypothetical protein
MSYAISVTFADHYVNVRSDTVDLARYASIMFGHHVDAPDDDVSVEVRLEQQDERYTITSPVRAGDIETATFSSLGEVMFELRDRVQFLLSRNQRDHLIVHAGAAIVNDKLIVYPAASGSGKTTLSAWFIGQGATLLSDELIALSPEGMVTGFAQALNVKASGRKVFFEALGKREADVDLVNQPNGNAFVSWKQKLPLNTWRQMDSFLLPKYQPDLEQDCVVEEISPAKVAAAIMENTINLRNFERMGLGLVSSCSTNFRCLEERYSQLDLRTLTSHKYF